MQPDRLERFYGSEGWGFESLRARSVLRQTTRPLTSGNAVGGLARLGMDIGVILHHRSALGCLG